MAQKVRVEILDDLDGSTATQTVPFTLDGVSYEIDLSDDNATALRDGRKLRVATGQSTTVTTADRERNQQIRAWANANGYAVSERGRLSSEVISAYDQAQAAEAEAPARAPRKRAPRKRVAAATK
ncbi:histone-like nucleoid-structuring protein Lsr2 [Amycolatopsis balhimycina]|uniref:histone-like nucleoid-structuring protein Lsr2 n=1 Tax=Amycolatopsis balhimycina TaxID=208443 RepID=UPI00038075C7|nr:Lsr2 family protein [Amycolatopsis balhimycina]